MRRVLSIVLYGVSGFFVYGTSFSGFLRLPDTEAHAIKWWLLGGMITIAVVTQLLGLALVGFRNWRRETGLMLLWAEGVSVFAVFTFACLSMDVEVRRAMAAEQAWLFGDYAVGGGCILVGGGLGLLLLVSSKRRAVLAASVTPR